MRMLLVSWIYGPHASSIRPERTPSPGAARPGPPLPSPRAHRTLVRRRAGRQRARMTGPVWPLAPPLDTRLPRGSQPGGRGRVCERRHRAPIVRLKRAARSLARPLVKVPPAGPGAHTTGPPSLGRSRGGWTPTMPRGAAALGYTPVVPPRRSRGEPGTSARELSTRRTASARVWRRLPGCRRLCSQCEQLDVLVLGCIGFALIIDALR